MSIKPLQSTSGVGVMGGSDATMNAARSLPAVAAGEGGAERRAVDMAVSCQTRRPLLPHRHEFSSQHALSVLFGLQVRLVGGTAF